ncbi:methyltransferase, partial [Burkholderia pseudomallei]
MSTVIEARPPVREGGEIESQVNYLGKGVAGTVAYTFEQPPGRRWRTGELAR